jgi:hypothetical protein
MATLISAGLLALICQAAICGIVRRKMLLERESMYAAPN